MGTGELVDGLGTSRCDVLWIYTRVAWVTESRSSRVGGVPVCRVPGGGEGGADLQGRGVVVFTGGQP